MQELKKDIEAILFMTEEIISEEQLALFLNKDIQLIKEAINSLILEYQNKGINIFKIDNGYKMACNTQKEELINLFLSKEAKFSLSKAAMETIAVIAYKQPITRAEIEDLRGVNSDAIISNLLEKNLITEVGFSDNIGRPALLGTTPDFLRHFGLNNLKDLPNFEQLDRQLTLENM